MTDTKWEESGADHADSAALWLCRDAGLSRRQVLALYAGGLERADRLFEMTEAEIRETCLRGSLRGCKDEEPVRQAERQGMLMTQKLVQSMSRTSDADRRAQAELLRKGNIRFASWQDAHYPDRLRNIPDPPSALYYRGTLPSDDRPSTAVIGARAASRYGIQQAVLFAGTLATAGVQIVSGMARGIDGAAGLEALEAGGASYAVLGNGPDICYPKENHRLYEALSAGVRGGGVLSEYPPGTKPIPGLFPLRNRLISGLSDILLVVLAKEKSGTMITVETALAQDRDVFAVPGRNGDLLSAGCNRLIRQGAFIALSPDDLLMRLGIGVQNADANGNDLFAGAAQGAGQSGAGSTGQCGAEITGQSGDADNGQGSLRGQIPVITGAAERALWECLDTADLQELDVLREEMARRLGRAVSIREAGAVMAGLLVRGLAEEPCTGYYCRAVQRPSRRG